jgi:acetyl esterase/lipase
VGAVDGFRNEDIAYAIRLSQADVPTELHVYPGEPHGVALFAAAGVAQRYTHGIAEWVGRQLRAPTI